MGRPVCLRLSDRQAGELAARSRETGRTELTLIREAIDEYLHREAREARLRIIEEEVRVLKAEVRRQSDRVVAHVVRTAKAAYLVLYLQSELATGRKLDEALILEAEEFAAQQIRRRVDDLPHTTTVMYDEPVPPLVDDPYADAPPAPANGAISTPASESAST